MPQFHRQGKSISFLEWLPAKRKLKSYFQLVTDFKNGDATVLELFKAYEFHILPLVNPDGYEFSQSSVSFQSRFINCCRSTSKNCKKKQTRLWRKNRKPSAGSTCIGVDLNRNWGYQWMVIGASSDPCADTFAGPRADSEIETQAIQKVIMDKGNFEIFMTLHSYGQFWMIPWAWGSVSPNAALLKAKSAIGAAALQAVSGMLIQSTDHRRCLCNDLLFSYAGTKFSIGSVPELLCKKKTTSLREFRARVTSFLFSIRCCCWRFI